MKIVILVLLVFASSQVSSKEIPLDLRVDTFYEALIMSFEQKFRAREQLKEWNEKELEFNNTNRIDENGNCYKKAKGEVLMVLRVETSGEISGVYTSKDNEKAKCFIKNHLGIVLPKPPFGPVYLLKRML